ncbi:hypothetical protein BGX38DRAFT_1270408 [Terfezia claveryi]|nr:hypothetical protein BGX38DRAFT_1270408 [Terfezia claveryi]
MTPTTHALPCHFLEGEYTTAVAERYRDQVSPGPPSVSDTEAQIKASPITITAETQTPILTYAEAATQSAPPPRLKGKGKGKESQLPAPKIHLDRLAHIQAGLSYTLQGIEEKRLAAGPLKALGKTSSLVILTPHPGYNQYEDADKLAAFSSARGPSVSSSSMVTEGDIRQASKAYRSKALTAKGFGVVEPTRTISIHMATNGKRPPEILASISKSEPSACQCGRHSQDGRHITLDCLDFRDQRAALGSIKDWEDLDRLIWIQEEDGVNMMRWRLSSVSSTGR